MQQVTLQILLLAGHGEDVKGPQNLGQKPLALHPGQFPPGADAGAEAEEGEAFGVVVAEGRVGEGVVGRQPSLGAEAHGLVEEARAAGEGEETALAVDPLGDVPAVDDGAGTQPWQARVVARQQAQRLLQTGPQVRDVAVR